MRVADDDSVEFVPEPVVAEPGREGLKRFLDMIRAETPSMTRLSPKRFVTSVSSATSFPERSASCADTTQKHTASSH